MSTCGARPLFLLDSMLPNQDWNCCSRNDEKFANIDAARSKKKKNGTTHTDHSLECVRACEDLCWNQDKSAPHHFETNALAEHAASRVKKKGLRHFWFSRAFQTCCRKKRWDGPDICETYKTKWQKESHRTKQSLALPFDGSIAPFRS